MQRYSRVLLLGCAAACHLALSGCASEFIEVRPGSEKVTLADVEQINGCKNMGTVTASVLSGVGFINRSIEDVDANLAQLARNGAVDIGGDTIVKGERPAVGKRNFAVYKCRQ